MLAPKRLFKLAKSSTVINNEEETSSLYIIIFEKEIIALMKREDL
jgi:hypothetical protein